MEQKRIKEIEARAKLEFEYIRDTEIAHMTLECLSEIERLQKELCDANEIIETMEAEPEDKSQDDTCVSPYFARRLRTCEDILEHYGISECEELEAILRANADKKTITLPFKPKRGKTLIDITECVEKRNDPEWYEVDGSEITISYNNGDDEPIFTIDCTDYFTDSFGTVIFEDEKEAFAAIAAIQWDSEQKKEKNKPLKVSELRNLEREPIYVKLGSMVEGWAIVHFVNNTVVLYGFGEGHSYTTSLEFYSEDNLANEKYTICYPSGCIWTAYKDKPER